MSTNTVHTATCDSCGTKEEFKDFRSGGGLPASWVCAKLRGLESNGGVPCYTLDLCPACQIKALAVLGKGE